MKAVYSYWTDGMSINTVNAGFNNLADMAEVMTLSIRMLKRFNPRITEVEFVTNTIGKQMFSDRYPVPFDRVCVALDALNGKCNHDHWAYAKICAYALQAEPFVHIDNDVILWKPLSDELLESPLFFQNKEMVATHTGYAVMLDWFHGHLPKGIGKNVDWAYNCGVVGANDLDTIREWKATVDEFLFSPQNAIKWSTIDNKHSTNHLFEQYFISSLIKTKGIQPGELIPDFDYGVSTDLITHLWGDSKRKPQNMDRVRKRLAASFPEDAAALRQVEVEHRDIFTSIYRTRKWGEGSGGGSSIETTTGYRDFLSDFIKEKGIATVVDLACGYWAFNGLVRWHGAKYLGIDVVEAVIADNLAGYQASDRNWEIADIRTCEFPECDLLIIKDVLIHWTNQEVRDFFKRDLRAKYILVTNDDRVGDTNIDINVPGEFRDIDITKAPFHIRAEVVHKWTTASKSTWLIIR